MSDLNPEDRALLDLARDGHEPTNGDRARVRGALLVRLGAATGLAATTSVTSKAATALVLIKVFAAVAVAGAIGGTGVVTYRMTHPARMQVVATSGAGAYETQANAASVVALPAAIPEVAMRTAEPAAADTVIQPRSVKRNDEPTAHRSSATPSLLAAWPADPPSTPAPETTSAPPDLPSTTAVPVPPLTPTTLEAETRLVRAGVAALHGGDAARALALFDEHARAFPSGALAEERAAERIVALGDLRRCDEARAAGADFLRDHPHSPLTARVRGACTHTPNP